MADGLRFMPRCSGAYRDRLLLRALAFLSVTMAHHEKAPGGVAKVRHPEPVKGAGC